jgi:signal transduction histidine kinase
MIGRTIGGYRITEQIGQGGMATVYKAYDPATERDVAIKILPQQYASDSGFKARFEIEAKAIARLELDLKGEWLIFRVIDQGMGIKDADLPQIFDPFYRSEDVNAIKGTGLGLSIVQDCVERHHGRIYVESTWGEGSTFVVELPTQVDNPTT